MSSIWVDYVIAQPLYDLDEKNMMTFCYEKYII
jgi:hypothetical protein